MFCAAVVAVLTISAIVPMVYGAGEEEIRSANASLDPQDLFLFETFDSWSDLDPDWTIWNRSLGSFENWFDVADGALDASNNGVLIQEDYLSYANWTGTMVCDTNISISFDIYLPLGYDDKIGWAGQAFWFILYGDDESPVLYTRWVMDNPWDTYPIGWVYLPGGTTSMVQICPFEAGWHSVSYSLFAGSDSWTGSFDGVQYPGLALSSDNVLGNITKVQFMNALREEVQHFKMDNLRIESGAATQVNAAPVFEVPLIDAYNTTESEPTIFEVEVSDSDGDPITLDWSFGDGSHEHMVIAENTSLGHTVIASHSYYPQGQYLLELVISDGMFETSCSSMVYVASSGVVPETQMVLEGVPSSVHVNETCGFTVSVQDEYGLPCTNYTGTVTFDSSDSSAALPPDYAFLPSDAGSHYFETGVTFFTEGDHWIRATDVVDPALQAMISNVTVLPDLSEREWTILVYLDADNDLEKEGIEDFLEMSSVGSDEDVNVVVQLDRIPGYDSSNEDWTGTMRFLVEPGMMPISENAVMDLGELNMGDPDTLADFVSWGVTHYPAKKYSLILWDHGGGWSGAICWDDTSHYDALTMAEVETALSEVASSSGERMDMLGYDACLMAMAEVMYETIEYVDDVVASEDLEPLDGWPYDTFLADLVAVPTMSPANLSEIIVDRYMQSYGPSQQICLSAVDMTAAQAMYDAIECFAQELILALPNHKETIEHCRLNTTAFDYFMYVDLYRFAWNVGDIYTTAGLNMAADDLTAAIEAAVIAEEHSSQYWDLGGVSIYFPESLYQYNPYYETDLDFTADTSWDEFLRAYLDGGTNIPPAANMTWWPYQPEPGQTVSFNAEGSWDPDGWIVWYVWEFDDNQTAEGLYVDHIFEQAGDYLVTLTVYDNEGEWDSISSVVSIGHNEAPVVELSHSPENPMPGEAVHFDGSASYDPDGFIEFFLFEFGDGTADWTTASYTWHTYHMAGDYEVILTAWDNNGEASSDTIVVQVGYQSVPPVAVIAYDTPRPLVGETVIFNGTFSVDPDGTIVSYIWQMGDGTLLQGAVVSHAYLHNGMYEVKLTVIDDEGLADEGTTLIAVASVPTAEFDYHPKNPVPNQVVDFYAYGSYDEVGIVEFVWSFGDGSYATGWHVQHIFNDAGVYTVVLTVTNTNGVQASSSKEVEVDRGSIGVVGTVVDPDLNPIISASVELYQDGALVAETETGTDGKFILENLPRGECMLRISKNGYEAEEFPITINRYVTDIGSVVLAPHGSGSRTLTTLDVLDMSVLFSVVVILGFVMPLGLKNMFRRRE